MNTTLETATKEPPESEGSTVDKSEERIQKMFGEISPRYDFMNHFLSGGTDIYWRRRAVRFVAPSGDAPILDVCTGTGDLALTYWKKAKKAVSVIGTDFTPKMLELARAKQERKNIPTEGTPSVSFLQADTQELPFEDDTFQIVSVAFGLRNVTDTMRGLREMVRVCKPGGQVLVLEFTMPKNRVFGGMYRWYFKKVLPKLGQLLARNKQSAYNYLPDSVSEFPQREELTAMMEDAGLVNTKYKSLTFGVAAMYRGEKPSSTN